MDRNACLGCVAWCGLVWPIDGAVVIVLEIKRLNDRTTISHSRLRLDCIFAMVKKVQFYHPLELRLNANLSSRIELSNHPTDAKRGSALLLVTQLLRVSSLQQ